MAELHTTLLAGGLIKNRREGPRQSHEAGVRVPVVAGHDGSPRRMRGSCRVPSGARKEEDDDISRAPGSDH
jgi:hypothetical protein